MPQLTVGALIHRELCPVLILSVHGCAFGGLFGIKGQFFVTWKACGTHVICFRLCPPVYQVRLLPQPRGTERW